MYECFIHTFRTRISLFLITSYLYQNIKGVFVLKKTFHELITSTSWSEVEKEVHDFYPDEDPEYFKHLFWKLYNLTPKANDNGVKLKLDMFEENDFSSTEIEEEDYYYEIDFYNEINDELWEMYLGFHIHPDTLNNLSSAEIVCHMFFELTYGDLENLIG